MKRDSLAVLCALVGAAALTVSCKVVDAPAAPTTVEAAEVAHRVALNAEAVAAVHHQNTMLLWAFGIGGVVGMLGVALIVVTAIFLRGTSLSGRLLLLGGGMVGFGVLVCAIATAFPRYGQEIALGATILIGLVLAFGAWVGVDIALAWRKALKQTIATTEEAKKAMSDEPRKAVFGDHGIADSIQSPTTRKIVSKLRTQLKGKDNAG